MVSGSVCRHADQPRGDATTAEHGRNLYDVDESLNLTYQRLRQNPPHHGDQPNRGLCRCCNESEAILQMDMPGGDVTQLFA